MIEDFQIPYVYAVETSIGQYYDYITHKTEAFNVEKWNQLGEDFGKALKFYFESIEQLT